jgi:hypothetical protein
MLSEEKLPRDECLDQLRLCRSQLTALNRGNAGVQTAQPDASGKKATSPHRLPMLLTKTFAVIRHQNRSFHLLKSHTNDNDYHLQWNCGGDSIFGEWLGEAVQGAGAHCPLSASDAD